MGEKNLAQWLLALSPNNPVGGRDVPTERALLETLLRNIPTAMPCRSVPEGSFAKRTSWRNTPAGPRRTVCAIGAFDGVHLGHRALIERAREEADARGDELVVVTFSPDPSVVLTPGRPQRLLLGDADRVSALESIGGVDRVVVIDFTAELAALPYERFVRETLGELMDLDVIVVGSDFRLGVGGAGTVDALCELGRVDGFDVIGMDLLDEGGSPVTATRVRGLLAQGHVEEAAGLLGRCHFVRGEVEHGRGEGTSFGFPTANVRVSDGLCLPAEGVYAGYVACSKTAWPAAINVGKPRSFSPGEEGEPFLEATLLGFDGDLYGREVCVVFVRWLREPRLFSSVGELERVVLGNVSWVRATLGERGVSLGGEVLA